MTAVVSQVHDFQPFVIFLPQTSENWHLSLIEIMGKRIMSWLDMPMEDWGSRKTVLL